MANAKDTDKDKEGKKRHSPQLLERYRGRIGLLKVSHDYYQKDNIAKAVEGYCKYLNIISSYYWIKEEELKPQIFDAKRDAAEMLLISQVYWGLAKAYDRNPKLQGECKRCLDQYTKFSIGFKHQYLNSEMVRKFLKRGIAYNPKLFEMTYKRIQVESKKCYLATYCFGEEDLVTEQLRNFKTQIQHSKLGYHFICGYYRFSPIIVNCSESYPLFGKVLRFILRPVLSLFSALVSFRRGR